MSIESSARLDIVPIWGHLNEMLIDLVDVMPEDRLDWSPKPELWGFRRILVHLCDAREEWMTRAINDGEPNTRDYATVRSKEAIQEALRRTWERVERTITDQSRLDATYRDRWWDKAPLLDGHWVAFHLLEHDIHHPADLLLYLALLGVDTPQVWTP